MKKLIFNFGISLLWYLAINFIGYLLRYIYYPSMMLSNTLPTNPPMWLMLLIDTVIIILTIILPAILYFILGKNLNLLRNGITNYLSVCGSFIFAAAIIYYQFKFTPGNAQLIFDMNASFGLLLETIVEIFNAKKSDLGYYIVAVIPSIITWLGMFYQSKKLSKVPKQQMSTNKI